MSWVDKGVSATLAALVAAQIDARFLALDLSRGSRIIWSEIVPAMTQATGKPWTEPMCQRLWRQIA
jgi:hypothetical protein